MAMQLDNIPTVHEMGKILRIAILYRNSFRRSDPDRFDWLDSAIKMTGTNVRMALESLYYVADAGKNSRDDENKMLANWLFSLVKNFHKPRSRSF